MFNPYLPRLPNIAFLTVASEISPSTKRINAPITVIINAGLSRPLRKIHIKIPSTTVVIPIKAKDCLNDLLSLVRNLSNDSLFDVVSGFGRNLSFFHQA